MSSRAVLFASLLGTSCALTFFVACGDTTFAGGESHDGGGDGASDEASSSDGGSKGDGGSSSDAALSSGCPASAPGAGTACTINGLACEYGGSDLEACDTIAKCTGGSFEITPPGEACTRDAGGSCPPTLGEVKPGAACPVFGQMCLYPEGSCGCGFVDHTSDEWVCDTVPGPGCPTPRPMLGSACSPDGLDCDYGSCTILGNPNMECDGGTWSAVSVACPP